jgi:hypothetical protein
MLGQRIDGLRQRVFRLFDRVFLRFSAGNTAGKIGKPRAERSLGTMLQNCRIEPLFDLATSWLYAISHTTVW